MKSYRKAMEGINYAASVLTLAQPVIEVTVGQTITPSSVVLIEMVYEINLTTKLSDLSKA